MTDTFAQLRSKADELAAKFSTEWGVFRRFVASRPLTGFWFGVAIGVGLGYLCSVL